MNERTQEKGQSVTIVVNGQEKSVDKKDELTFDEVVDLAFDSRPSGPNVLFTITFRRGTGSKPEGALAQNETVKVKTGMVLNVTATDKS